MTISRQRFAFSDTGTQIDTGPPFVGEIMQVRWNPTSDTGAALQLGLYPKEGDTGDGWLFIDDTGGLRANFIIAPRQHIAFLDGSNASDTGRAPIVSAGDRLRAKVSAQGTSTTVVSGTLYVWMKAGY